MDFSQIKRRGTAFALVAAALSGLSGAQSSAAIAAPAADQPVSIQTASSPGRPMVDPGQHARYRTPVQVVVVKKPPVAKAAAVTKHATSTKVAPRPAITSPAAKAAAQPKAAVKPKAATKAVAKAKTVTKPKAKPVKKSKPVTKPAPSKPKTSTPAFQAPSVRYTGATCRKSGANTWSITHTWVASGGSYADLGSAQNRISPVTVTGGTRTWTFVTTESGSEAPEVTDAYLGRIIAPIGRTGDINSWRSVERQVDMVQVRC